MNEHPLRKRFDNIIDAYDNISIAAERYFVDKGWMKITDTIHSIEADPNYLECILSDGNVLHVSYDEILNDMYVRDTELGKLI